MKTANSKGEQLFFILSFIVLAVFAGIILLYINQKGQYPWGSDTYGHLYKGRILYDSLRSGDWFLNYNESWYNGVQPFRYWAPLPYYILAALNLIVSDIFKAYNLFIFLMFILGGLGWLCWGYYLKRQGLALVVAILWFFVPNNLRILFSEGNLPYTVVNSLLPFVMLYSFRTVRDSCLRSSILLAVLMGMVTLSHAMLAAMTGIALLLFACLDAAVNKSFKSSLHLLAYAFMGIMLSSFWLFPALRGGIFSLERGAVASVMRQLTYFIVNSLNPLLRFENIEIYYFGLAFALAALFGLLFSHKSQRAYFAGALIILLGTTRAALPLLEKLPLNQLFWMSRFTSIAMAMILAGILTWKKLRKSVLIGLLLLLALDAAASFKVLGFNGQYPTQLAAALDHAAETASQRIAVLDSSHFGSFPSYYIPYNRVGGETKQVYGWAWQGAATAQNIVLLNTALEMEYHELMFDRALELGADTLVIKKSFVSSLDALDEKAGRAGYVKQGEDETTVIYKYPVVGNFATRAYYEGIAIGSYAANMQYIFPKLIKGKSNGIEEYSYEELKGYKTIYLSGFQYGDKQQAEALLLKLAEQGIKIVIDAVSLQESFLGIRVEPIAIKEGYQDLYYKNQRLEMQAFPAELSNWKTVFLQGVDTEANYQVINNRIVGYIGQAGNENISVIGLNLPYYAFLTKDASAVKLLEDIFAMKAYETPIRQLLSIQLRLEDNILSVKAEEPELILPVAAIDAFKVQKGSCSSINNLVYMQSTELELYISYPYLGIGSILSLIFLGLMLAVTGTILRINKKNRDHLVD